MSDNEYVRRLAYVGETVTGQAVMQNAAKSLTPVSLELGGKSANIIFDDADLDEAVEGSIEAIFRNQGQICLAGSRILVQEGDRKSTRLNSSHVAISYAVFCLKKKKHMQRDTRS